MLLIAHVRSEMYCNIFRLATNLKSSALPYKYTSRKKECVWEKGEVLQCYEMLQLTFTVARTDTIVSFSSPICSFGLAYVLDVDKILS